MKILRLAIFCFGPLWAAHAFAGVRFVVIDPKSRVAVRDAVMTLRSSRRSEALVIWSGECVDCKALKVSVTADRIVFVKLGETATIQDQEPPIQDIKITVTATRLRRTNTDASNGTQRTKEDITKFGGGNGDVKNVTKSTAGVSEDSSGQQHVRGEHSEITYVVDGIPLPDTLSGRQGSIVVPSTIESVDVILGGFAPEFGGQTAAILNIKTLPGAKNRRNDFSFTRGSYNASNLDLTSVGPLGSKASYVMHLSGNHTDSASEPQQPDDQTAHNVSSDQNAFVKLNLHPTSRDRFALTLSTNPAKLEIGNRTGLPFSFASAGQGYGFGGLRNADGTRPDANGDLGSGTILLKSQEQDRMDINSKESNEFATATWQRKIDEQTSGQLGLTFLHSGQDVTNNNPAVDLDNLPVDSSIEYNPTVSRNVHHVQLNGSVSSKKGSHSLKAGFILDKQSGSESYQMIPASQLALDAIFASAPNLAPKGHATGKKDVNGNDVYIADSNVSPILRVERDGYYYAAFLQDTWRISSKATLNYGVRGDWYRQTQNLGQETVDRFLLSPRINMSYVLDKTTVVRGSYNKLFNTPPLAQGAIIGNPLQPPVVNQLDISIEKQLPTNQSVKLAYYVKDIRDQIDVGLLIPGSETGIYSGVNLEKGGVHGLEFSYEKSAPKAGGWDVYFNATMSAAKPNGKDNTGSEVDDFNDHDQRFSLGLGLAYTLKSGASVATTIEHGSGLASSIVPPSLSRTPRTQVDLHLTSGDKLFHGSGGLGLDIENLFDSREVINFQSAFSGTRFQKGRTVALSAFFKF